MECSICRSYCTTNSHGSPEKQTLVWHPIKTDTKFTIPKIFSPTVGCPNIGNEQGKVKSDSTHDRGKQKVIRIVPRNNNASNRLLPIVSRYSLNAHKILLNNLDNEWRGSMNFGRVGVRTVVRTKHDDVVHIRVPFVHVVDCNPRSRIKRTARRFMSFPIRSLASYKVRFQRLTRNLKHP